MGRQLTLFVLLFATVAAAVATAVVRRPDARLPIFDAHVHYSQPAWQLYSVRQIRRLLSDAGIAGAAVSSSPDEGTRRLIGLNRSRFVAVLRPYRTGVTAGNWMIDPEGAAYLVQRLASGSYRGIGEVHLQSASEATQPMARRAAELAIERDILLHVHGGAAPIQSLRWQFPELKLLWAHGGMVEPPEVIGPLLEGDDKLWVELSFRAADIDGGGWVKPAWRSLFVNYPDRFVIGSDTYVTSRWDNYRELIDEHRTWLAQLPKDVAEAIAYRNAARLFLGTE